VSDRAHHPLVAILDAAAAGRFPPADGGVQVLPPDPGGTVAVVALTGRAYVLADVRPENVVARGADGFGGALDPALLLWLAGDDRHIGSIDVVLVRRGAGGGVPMDSLRRTDGHDEHPRVRRARGHRRNLEVYADTDGVVMLGHGLVGRRELSVELFDPGAASAGAGRRLIAAGLTRVGSEEWCWAQVAAGNARSLRAFLACGFVPVGSEVLLTGHDGR
jgi:hypothetical protein